MVIPLHQPHITGKEIAYIQQAMQSSHLAGNGFFTQACQSFLEQKYGFHKCLLTSSCTDALEMAALLLNIQAGDEVIIPSFTFVSTANAFLLRGAKVVLADSQKNHPNLDANQLEQLINPRTKAIVVMHYAGVACDMTAIQAIAQKHQLYIIEDAAQAIDAYYKDKPLGSLGHLAAFSFHETKNIHAGGEGGVLVINDPQFISQAEIIWEKGTNRAAFTRGEVEKYAWQALGSSFLPSEITAATLYAQLESLSKIQAKRQILWQNYQLAFADLEQKECIQLPKIPTSAGHNAHIFYVNCPSEKVRQKLISYLKEQGIQAAFHYIPLHGSPYFQKHHAPPLALTHCEYHAQTLLRLPLFFDLSEAQQNKVLDCLYNFFRI